MFHFRRRTLWIIIYLTIPLIFILNQLGPGSSDDEQSANETALVCTAEQCLLPSPSDFEFVLVSGLLPLVPVSSVPVPEGVSLEVETRHHRLIARFTLGPDSAEVFFTFLQAWLPAGSDPVWAVTAKDPKAWGERLAIVEGQGMAVDIPGTSLEDGQLTIPPVGTVEGLAFQLWLSILQQRLQVEGVARLRVDTRPYPGRVLGLVELSESHLQPISEAEWQGAHDAWMDIALQPLTPRQQHRYAEQALLFQQSLSKLLERDQRLQQLTLSDLQKQRERTIEVFQNTRQSLN